MSGIIKPVSNPKPIPTSQPNQFVLPQYKINGGGDIHDTFKIDRYDNLYDYHSTIRIPGNKSK